MSLIKQKCDLALPYAGAFLKKNDKYIVLYSYSNNLSITFNTLNV